MTLRRFVDGMHTGKRNSTASTVGGASRRHCQGLVFADIDTKPGKRGQETFDVVRSAVRLAADVVVTDRQAAVGTIGIAADISSPLALTRATIRESTSPSTSFSPAA